MSSRIAVNLEQVDELTATGLRGESGRSDNDAGEDKKGAAAGDAADGARRRQARRFGQENPVPAGGAGAIKNADKIDQR